MSSETELFPEVRTARVVVGVTGSTSSGAALRRAVYEARRAGHALLVVLAWEPPGGDAAFRMVPEPTLLELWEGQARQRLDAAIAEAIGELPIDIDVRTLAVRAPAAFALTRLADQANDLLVMGAGPRHAVARVLRGSVRRQVVARATAPVLLVAPPNAPRALWRELRRIKPEDFLRTARQSC